MQAGLEAEKENPQADSSAEQGARCGAYNPEIMT